MSLYKNGAGPHEITIFKSHPEKAGTPLLTFGPFGEKLEQFPLLFEG